MARPRRGKKQPSGTVPLPNSPKPVIQPIPNGQIKEIAQLIRQEVRQEIRQELFSGPMPPPQLIREYDQMYPGAARFFFEEVQKQTDHRINIETRVVESNIRNERRGSWFAFIITMTALVGGMALFSFGIDTAGIILAVGALGTLATVFITGKLLSKKRLADTEKKES